MTKAFIDFVRNHLNDDTARLLLSAARYPDIDMPLVVQQVEGIHTAQEKWPSLLEFENYLYPPRLNREQASSEETAIHKAHIVDELCGQTSLVSVADLTGGMGIDSITFAQRARPVNPLRSTQVLTHVDYIERNNELCALMEHNREVLGLENIHVHNNDCMEWLAASDRRFDIIFIDPARRSASGRKVAAFEDCEPNITQHMELLRSHCRWLMVKASPMIDIDLACRQLGDVAEVHIISVKGECKEAIFVCGEHEGETVLHSVVLGKKGQFYDCKFTRSEETSAQVRYCATIGNYLYEPDAALMKGGPFHLICQWTGLEKLAPNTHLYTADRLVNNFHGRIFEVLQEVTHNRKSIRQLLPEGKAHVVARNFPTEAAVLQRQLGLKEGGDLFLVATTIASRHVILLCRRITE